VIEALLDFCVIANVGEFIEAFESGDHVPFGVDLNLSTTPNNKSLTTPESVLALVYRRMVDFASPLVGRISMNSPLIVPVTDMGPIKARCLVPPEEPRLIGSWLGCGRAITTLRWKRNT
jgi:hypothetical protein